MNYKMPLLAIVASYFITLNAWSDCCFTKPPVDRPPLTYPCTTTVDFDACNDTPNRVGYLNDNARCSNDDFTCCVRGESGFIIDEGTLVPVETPTDCEPDSKAIRLDIVVDEFEATLSGDHVYLNGTVNNSENMAYLYIWRAQIEEDGQGSGTIIDHPTRIGARMEIGEGPFSFSKTDYYPQNGVNYYVLMDRDMSGKPTMHCDHIAYVVVGPNGIPNLELAEELCRELNLSILLHVFEP